MDPAQAAIRDFMRSPEHRDNVLDAGYHRMGVGAATGDSGLIMLTVVFTD